MSLPTSIAETYFTKPAPQRAIPNTGIEAKAAQLMLQSEMMLDGDPGKNLATFVTTYMEDEARSVITDNLHRNYIDHAEYPRTTEIARRCVLMIHDLFNGPKDQRKPGAWCAGSSEAVMLGALAMKWRWKNRQSAAGKSDATPNMVYGGDVHVVWDKFCRYFDVEPRKIDVPLGATTMTAEDFEPHIDENTIGVVAVAGTTFTGECDDIVGIDKMLKKVNTDKDLDVPMHVDAASGGFVFPFSDPDFEWDFRLETVKSINTSGHKFGLVYPGIGWLLFRDDNQLPEELVFYEDYLGQKDSTFTLNFSGSASFGLAQYYMFIREGREGYASHVRAMKMNAEALKTRLDKMDALTTFKSDSPTIPLVIASINEDEPFTATDLVEELKRRDSWLVPAYYLPPKNDKQQIIRMLVKVNQTRELVDALCEDFEESIKSLRAEATK